MLREYNHEFLIVDESNNSRKYEKTSRARTINKELHPLSMHFCNTCGLVMDLDNCYSYSDIDKNSGKKYQKYVCCVCSKLMARDKMHLKKKDKSKKNYSASTREAYSNILRSKNYPYCMSGDITALNFILKHEGADFRVCNQCRKEAKRELITEGVCNVCSPIVTTSEYRKFGQRYMLTGVHHGCGNAPVDNTAGICNADSVKKVSANSVINRLSSTAAVCNKSRTKKVVADKVITKRDTTNVVSAGSTEVVKKQTIKDVIINIKDSK